MWQTLIYTAVVLNAFCVGASYEDILDGQKREKYSTAKVVFLFLYAGVLGWLFLIVHLLLKLFKLFKRRKK